MEISLQQMCRTCLGSGLALISLHSTSAQTCTVGQMLGNISNIQVTETDKLPTKVCLSCVSEIKRCYFFKIKCESSQDTLQQYLREIEVDDGIEAENVSVKPEKLQQTIIFETNTVTELAKKNDADHEQPEKPKPTHSPTPDMHEIITNEIYEEENDEEDEVEIDQDNHQMEDAIEEDDEENEPTTIEVTQNVESSSYLLKVSEVSISDADTNTDEKLILIGCEECCRAFETQEDFQAHTANCGSRSMNKDEEQSEDDDVTVSKSHKKKNKKSSPKKCPNCPMEFVHQKNLDKHISKFHSPADDDADPLAPMKLHTHSNVKVEQIVKEENEEDEDDAYCDVDMPDSVPEDSILKPSLSLLSSVEHRCNRCGAGFVNKTSLLSHLKINKCTVTQFICKICSRVFINDKSLIEHIKDHAKAFKCTQCTKAFPTSDKLKRHNYTTHGDLKHQCIQCGRGFTMFSTLQDHLRIHSGEKPFLCAICGKGFSQKTNLTQHVNRHKNLKPFKCQECDVAFVSKGELNAHMRKHTGDHPFTCDQCNSSFTTSSSLVKHKRIHTGERPYACDLCPMRFLALGTLKNHRRTHTGEKPFKCTFCPRSFTQKSDCATHIRSHTGERPYICSVCGWGFPHSGTLKTHMKTHERNQISKKGEINDNESKSEQESMVVEMISVEEDHGVEEYL